MSIKLTASRTTALVATLCLMASLTITSCKKEVKPAADTGTGAAGTVGGAGTGAAPTVGGAGTAVPTVATALKPGDAAKVAPAKAALVMANSAVAKGDMKTAKTQFDKFNGIWPTVEPMVKASAGDKYAPIESGLAMVKTAMGAATPDKAEAGKGLKMAIDGLNVVMAKK